MQRMIGFVWGIDGSMLRVRMVRIMVANLGRFLVFRILKVFKVCSSFGRCWVCSIVA